MFHIYCCRCYIFIQVVNTSSFRVLLTYCSFCNYPANSYFSFKFRIRQHCPKTTQDTASTEIPTANIQFANIQLANCSNTSKCSCFDTKNQTDTLNSWEYKSNNLQLVRASMHAKKQPRHYFYSVALLRKNQSPVTQVLKWPSEKIWQSWSDS